MSAVAFENGSYDPYDSENQPKVYSISGFYDHIEYTNRLVLFLIGSILIVAIMAFILFKK